MEFRRGPLPVVEDLALARRILSEYVPWNAAQEAVRERMVAFIELHPGDAHHRSCLEGHLTASALLLDGEGERALLTLHGKLGKWLQLGGHCDGDANLAGVAWRELVEESGIESIEIDPRPIDLDIHAIPARPGEPEHLHLDTRFVARAAPGALARPGQESIELRWFRPDELDAIETDDSVRRLFTRAFARTGS